MMASGTGGDGEVALEFSRPFDERAQMEAQARGYLAAAAVRLADGRRYPVVFYDPVRLEQDLESEAESGRGCIAEPGLIVVPEITLDRMHAAVRLLYADGYFEHLRPAP
jgi:hypothetical protein